MTAPGPGLIRGVVLASGTRPAAGARVFFLSGPVPLPEIAAMSGEDGAFVLTAPAPGTYEVGAAADGFEPASATVRVAEGGIASVTLTLKPA